MEERKYYIEKLQKYYDYIRTAKTEILFIENCLADKNVYTDDVATLFEDIDRELEKAKGNITELINML